VAVLSPAADIRNLARQECMNNGAEKDDCGNQVEGLCPDSVQQNLWDALQMGIVVTRQAWREFVSIGIGNRIAAYTYGRQ
jgi:hypothetical protein